MIAFDNHQVDTKAWAIAFQGVDTMISPLMHDCGGRTPSRTMSTTRFERGESFSMHDGLSCVFDLLA